MSKCQQRELVFSHLVHSNLVFRLSNVLRHEIFVLQKRNQLLIVCMYISTLLSCLKIAAIEGDSIWVKLKVCTYLRMKIIEAQFFYFL